MSETLLRVAGVRVLYGRFLAVDGVSFALRGGDLMGMIGPNGAGKSTTLRAAAGLQPISSGTIEVMGYSVFDYPTIVGNHLGFAPDTPSVYDSLTVEQYLRFIADCYNLPHNLAGERIDHWLEQLWLGEKKSAKISSLSRGMRQRLAVARTLVPDPHVVLLDEPAAGLDPAGRVQFRQLLASLRDQGKALIVSSHILADLTEYCTHIGIMGHGNLLQFGTVAEVVNGQSHGTVRYRVVLAQRVGDIAARLDGIANLIIAQLDGDTLTLEYSSLRSGAAELLAALVHAGLPVAEFRALAPDLEQAYLRSGIRQVD